jgi:serine/threonine protein kinase
MIYLILTQADIWSFGITCIEIATGRAPHSLYTPAQILLKTMTENPPTLELEGQAHEFSKYFKELIDTCLVKKPDLIPSADNIVGQSFFAKSAKKKEYLVNALQLDRLPPLSERQTRSRSLTLFMSREPTSKAEIDFLDVIIEFVT